TILDYFAGSGTTGHAVIDLNRQDNGGRKYVLVEMGKHFDTVMLPRLKKAAYAPEWREGKPVSREKGMSQLTQYVRLESYEDTLDGLVLTPTDGDLLAGSAPALAEDYRLRYALGAETSASPCLMSGAFADPLVFTLSVVRDGARRETPADLPETFNLLLGLRVESRRRIDGVLAIAGRDPQGQCCLTLWRNLEIMDNDALKTWFAKHRACLPDPLDLVYVNGDHTLNAIRQEGETWTAVTIEPLFRELMFEVNER
ncbi:MAG: DNA methyltransferase, partial [Rhodospirillaceae bacterium]|nr:DNA methyltransferase [Rhodospirillaceae bacterium]